MSEEFRAVYIMGRGHSGTTVTDALLGNARGVESVGELMSGLNRGLAEDCSCGVTLADCDYWKAVATIYREKFGSDMYEDGKDIWRQSDVRHFFSALFADFSDANSVWGRHARLNLQVLAAISAHTGKKILVDSNKEFTRGVVYLKSDPNARVIHLFRRPASVVSSHYYRLNKGFPFKFMKKQYWPGKARFEILMLLSMGWTAGMVLGCIVGMRFPKRVLHVSYERLCEKPEQELKRIGDFLGVDTGPVIEGIRQDATFAVGHNIGGNEQRHEGGYKFLRNVKGRRRLPAVYRYCVNLVSFPGTMLRWLFVRA